MRRDKWDGTTLNRHLASLSAAEKLDYYGSAGKYIDYIGIKYKWPEEDIDLVKDILGVNVSKAEAANELIKARDNLRELQKAGKATQADADRVKAADAAYTKAKGNK